MPTERKLIKYTVFLLAILVFFLFAFPNSRASEDQAMVAVFEPDEAAQLQVVLRMLTPKANALQTIKSFLAYEYYFYGFPFFGSSALVLLPLKLIGVIDNTGLVMLILRQLISVLPMLIALILLTYMLDGFSTWRSIALFLFLVLAPAVLRNGFWWHPDGLVLLLVVLVIYFLWRDDNQFGSNFILPLWLQAF